MWPFRPPETLPDRSERHDTVIDLIEQVTALRGQLNAIELEWESVKEQVKKSYQRIEKANQRHDKRADDEQVDLEEQIAQPEPIVELRGFAKKLKEMGR